MVSGSIAISKLLRTQSLEFRLLTDERVQREEALFLDGRGNNIWASISLDLDKVLVFAVAADADAELLSAVVGDGIVHDCLGPVFNYYRR